ncbi:putative uracil-DNA glycosylase [Namao virus]|nr:putative uracil-DNA glycosylase [Namao virus]
MNKKTISYYFKKKSEQTKELCTICDVDQMINPAWKNIMNLSPSSLCEINKAYSSGAVVYPDFQDIFRWSWLTSPEQIRVVVLGHEPYCHGQDHGLSYSVKSTSYIPEDIKAICAELKRSYGCSETMLTGDFSHWCNQGVLMLNRVLTVKEYCPNSHYNKMGWTEATDRILQWINIHLYKVVFLIWGEYAYKTINRHVDSTKHLFLRADYPSVKNNFVGCNHFILTNEYIAGPKINWIG